MALTTEEMERLAHVEGFPAIAQLLARLADHERRVDELERVLLEVKELAMLGGEDNDEYLHIISQVTLDSVN